ncbi:FxsA family protein [Trujillonella endophytica]|uniref:UPF0716 protein FxsA n=1 Tax=Trujillonella endophytica TaxID=673521 RepID=A0A1H8T484_9ACTN|nr:FxsA family protein [Trujillella endophytica]SEO85751.1 UPF0716 protein FxsA [Trujillella endophytica]
MGRRVRTAFGVLALAEVVVFILVAAWIGVGWTILATLVTSALGLLLLGRQGTRALTELRAQAQERRPSGRALGDAGLIAVGGLLMLLPGFLGDIVGLLCLLPPTRPLLRALLGRVFVSRLPAHLRGPVHVRSARAEGVGGPAAARARPMVIEGEVLREDPRP